VDKNSADWFGRGARGQKFRLHGPCGQKFRGLGRLDKKSARPGRVDKNYAGQAVRVSQAVPSRAGPPGADRGCLIARSRKIDFQQKKVSPTPNTYFSGPQLLSRGQCVRYSILPRSCNLQRASRLRKTYLFNKVHSPTNVSSIPNAHSQNEVSSRLHRMLPFLKK